MRLALCVLGLVSLAGCHRRAVVVDEPAPTSGGVVVVSGGAYTTGGGTCSATLSVYGVSTGAGCTIDERVTGMPGVLTYPCEGGPATANFGGSLFSGEVGPGGDVTLEITTAFAFTDGCNWETKQFIRGNLASGVLAYEYREEPVPGQYGCASACLGSASVRVSR